jgi:tetratricopeptide (TPR) repeat protein
LQSTQWQGLGRRWSRAIHENDFGVILDWFTNYFFIFGGIALFIAGLAAWSEAGWGTGFRVLALGLLFAAACTVSGWLLGLLFGIPLSLARPQSGPAAAAGAAGAPAAAPGGAAPSLPPTSRANTNLEDISDWLTKTIVGVGLTQLFYIPHYLWDKAAKLNANGFGWDSHGQLLALALFLYFAPGGFWLGYVGTRTLLTRLFDIFDRPDAESVSQAANPLNLRLSLSERGIAPAEDGVAKADQQMLRLPLQALSSAREIAAWGAAQARAGNLGAARTALEEALHSEPANSDFKQQLATVYTALGLGDDAARLIAQVPNTQIALQHALYDPPPEGFQRAIAVGEELLKQPGQEKNGMLHVWLACAYGQQHAFEKSRGAAESILQPIKEKAVRETRAAIAADPRTRELLRQLWRPAPDATDRDLESFGADDPDFSQLLAER